MISLIIALVMGGIIGWLASKVMNTDAQQGLFLNIVVGCIGSMLGRFLLGPFVGVTGLRDGIDIKSIAVAFVGAIVLLGAINFFRRGKIR
jgi:uncharacterized membrane protein YeaQ/YmgE (transglycosylase-associated protein family)